MMMINPCSEAGDVKYLFLICNNTVDVREVLCCCSTVQPYLTSIQNGPLKGCTPYPNDWCRGSVAIRRIVSCTVRYSVQVVQVNSYSDSELSLVGDFST